jgi:hypothetical protein
MLTASIIRAVRKPRAKKLVENTRISMSDKVETWQDQWMRGLILCLHPLLLRTLKHGGFITYHGLHNVTLWEFRYFRNLNFSSTFTFILMLQFITKYVYSLTVIYFTDYTKKTCHKYIKLKTCSIN